MAIFEVYLSPNAVTDNRNAFDAGLDKLSNLQFVRDGVSYLALIFPGLWLVWKRLWFALLVYGLISTGLFFLNQTGKAPLIILALFLSILPGLYLFLEGSRLLSSRLQRRGWQFIGVVEAPNIEIAERRFLTNSLNFPIKPVNTDTHSGLLASRATSARNHDERPEFGLFSES